MSGSGQLSDIARLRRESALVSGRRKLPVRWRPEADLRLRNVVGSSAPSAAARISAPNGGVERAKRALSGRRGHLHKSAETGSRQPIHAVRPPYCSLATKALEQLVSSTKSNEVSRQRTRRIARRRGCRGLAPLDRCRQIVEAGLPRRARAPEALNHLRQSSSGLPNAASKAVRAHADRTIPSSASSTSE